MSEQQNKATLASEVDSDVLNPEPHGKIEECFLKLSLAENDYHLNKQVPILDDLPTPLDLYRDWVAPNRPVIFRGAVREWPAIKKWSFKYLREKVGNKEVSVAVTPNGYADAPCSGYFVMPEERSMKFGNFLNIMENPSIQPGVFYVQKQNSNFTMEFPEIICDAAPDITWFTEALGRNPDAVNFWMGDQRAVSSTFSGRALLWLSEALTEMALTTASHQLQEPCLAFWRPKPELGLLTKMQETGDNYHHPHQESIQKIGEALQASARFIENKALKQPNDCK